MVKNYAFLTDSETHEIIDRVVGNGIALMAELPYICAKCLSLNHENPNRYTVNIAAGSIFKSGQVPQSSLELYGLMWIETKKERN